MGCGAWVQLKGQLTIDPLQDLQQRTSLQGRGDSHWLGEAGAGCFFMEEI